MSSDTDNLPSINQRAEQEITHKETTSIIETHQSSQSHVAIDVNHDVVMSNGSAVRLLEDDEVTQTENRTQVETQRDNSDTEVPHRSSKETQTDVTERQMDNIERQTDAMEHQTTNIDRQTDAMERQTDVAECHTKTEYKIEKEETNSQVISEICKINQLESHTMEENHHIDVVSNNNQTNVPNCENESSHVAENDLKISRSLLDNISSDLNKIENDLKQTNFTNTDNIAEKIAANIIVSTEEKTEVNNTISSSEICTVQTELSKSSAEYRSDLHLEKTSKVSSKEEESRVNKENAKNIDLSALKDQKPQQLEPVKETVADGQPPLPGSPSKSEAETEEVDVSCRNGFHSAEIKEENLKSQLKEIIKEIDLEVNKEEGEYILQHTWHAKGEYVIEKTPIEYQEIVPVKVPDIVAKETMVEKELPKNPTQKPSPAKVVKRKVIERKPSEESTGSTPIEIPEGVPLLARMLPKEGEQDGGRDKIPLERLFTPASDTEELILTKRKAYSSSSFYRPDHPTIEDQVHLAHKISFSLVDDNNKQSKGQSMYMKRKTKSTKWAHTGYEVGYPEGQWQANESDLLPPKESKEPPSLKLLLNPKGIHDYNSVQDEEYEEQTTTPNHIQYQLTGIGVGKEIVTDLQSPTGKGAALFAKRKKRMDKFIIDETNVQKSLVHKHEVAATINENSYSSAVPINNTVSHPGSKNLPDLSNILTQPKPTKKSILSSPKGKTVKRSNTVSFSSLDRGFSMRNPTPSMRERRVQIKSWGSQKSNGTSLDVITGNRPHAQKRFSHIELSSTNKSVSSDGRPLDYGKKQKTNTMYTAEVKVEEKAALSPPISFEFNGIDASHYLDLAMTNQEKRKSFNLAAKGWGTYNHFYTPVHVGPTS